MMNIARILRSFEKLDPATREAFTILVEELQRAQAAIITR